MDVSKLKQYGAIKREIKMMERQIERLHSKSGYVADTVVSGSEFPYKKHTVVISGYAYDSVRHKKIEDVEMRLSKRKTDLACELESMETFIDTIDNSEMRQIIEYRYIDELSWKRIAFKLGKHDESYPRQKHNNFFNKNYALPKIPN